MQIIFQIPLKLISIFWITLYLDFIPVQAKLPQGKQFRERSFLSSIPPMEQFNIPFSQVNNTTLSSGYIGIGYTVFPAISSIFS